MSLPASAPKVTCTLSKPLQAEGTVGSITSAFLSIDRTLIWFDTGETIYMDPVSIDEFDASLEFEVIPVNAAGVFDLAGNLVTYWKYILRVGLLLDDGVTKTVNYEFQPIAGEDMDLDLVPQTGFVSTPPAVVSGSEVTIVYVGSNGGSP